MDPDDVYHKRFDDVMAMFVLWKDRDEFQQRLSIARKKKTLTSQSDATT